MTKMFMKNSNPGPLDAMEMYGIMNVLYGPENADKKFGELVGDVHEEEDEDDEQ